MPKRVALTGGIGSGKSTALELFAQRGAAVLSSDQVVHDLLSRDEIRAQVGEELGLGYLPTGREGRQRLAAAVFSDPEQLRRLQDILYPRVRDEIVAWQVSPLVAAAALSVVEIPMLFEAGMEGLFDRIVLVTAPVELRLSRCREPERRVDFERRVAMQLPEAVKKRRSHFVYDNSGAREELAVFIEQTFAALTSDGG